jgi:hypothetical protein
MHQGLPCFTGESGSPDAPQVLVVVFFLLQLQLLLRLLYIAKYNNECSGSAHEDAKTIEIGYLKS